MSYNKNSRREFLRKLACVACGGGTAAMIPQLRMIGTALANTQALTGYKALVCIYLYGDNDGFNTIVPYTTGLYAQYAASRRNLALAQADVQANALSGTASDGGQYGTHPALGDQTAGGGNAGMRALFNNGKMAIVANVGTLLYPLTSAQYRQGNVPVPPQLFSHADQTPQWQTARPDDPTALGWSGRVADLLYTANSGTLPMSVTLSNGNVWQRGAVVNQYALGTGDVDGMDYLGTGRESGVIGDNPGGATAYNALFA